MKKSRTKHKKRQFTLIEVLVVCILIAILSSLGVAGYTVAMNKAADSQTISIIKQIEIAMESFKQKNGYYLQQPSGGDLTITDDLIEFLPDAEKWKRNGIITSNKLYDAYGNSFQYRCPGDHNRGSFDLESKGRDDTQADNINNWNMQ